MKSLRNIFTIAILVALGFFMYNTRNIKESNKVEQEKIELEFSKNSIIYQQLSLNKSDLFPFNCGGRF